MVPSRGRGGRTVWEEGSLGKFKSVLVTPSRTGNIRKMFSHFLGNILTDLDLRKGEHLPE